jgi:hypothetical protein
MFLPKKIVSLSRFFSVFEYHCDNSFVLCFATRAARVFELKNRIEYFINPNRIYIFRIISARCTKWCKNLIKNNFTK